MKKILQFLLCALLGVTLFACGSSDESAQKEETKQEETKLTQAEQLEKEDPEIYDAASLVFMGFNLNFESDLKGNANYHAVAEYPYIDMYANMEKSNEVMVACTYSFQGDDSIGISAKAIFDADTKKIKKVDVTTTDPATTQESIIFTLTHIDGLTNSTDVYETVALRQVLEKTDESTAIYDVADKWTTFKSIGDEMTSYSVSVLEK